MSENSQNDSAHDQAVETIASSVTAPEQYTWDIVPEPPRCRRKLPKRFQKSKIFLLLLLILTVVLACMTLDYKPAVTETAQTESASDINICEILLSDIDRNCDQKLLTIDLSESQVNDLIAYVLQKRIPDCQQITAQWSNGSINGAITVPMHGVYLNIYYAAVPCFKDGKITFDLRCCKIGRLPLPAMIRDLIVQKLDSYTQNNALLVQVQKAVKQITVCDNNALQITLDIDQEPNPVYPEERNQQDDEKFAQIGENLLTVINQAAEKQTATCKLIIKADELNILLAGLIVNNWESVRQENEPHLYAVWQKGGLQIYSKYINKNGVYYNLSLHVALQVNHGKISAKVSSCTAGKIEFPAETIEKILQKHIDNTVNNSGEFTDMLNALISIKAVGNDKVEVEVDPNAASEMLQCMF